MKYVVKLGGTVLENAETLHGCAQAIVEMVRDGLFDRRMAISQCVHTDPAQQIQVAIALLIDEVHTFAAHEEDGIALVGLEQQLRFGGLDSSQLGHCKFN